MRICANGRGHGQTQTHSSCGSLTDTEWEGASPCPPFPSQAGKHLGAFQGVAWVTAVRHTAPSKVTLVLTLVAKLGNAWVLAFHQLKAFEGQRERTVQGVGGYLRRKHYGG